LGVIIVGAGIQLSSSGVHILYALGAANGRSFKGDVLVGADGIHLAILEQVFKPDPPRRSGYVAWCALDPW
jgi:2-polyprenyl-6-methoxyphenol hydroxylase-like FAD-dependent oxidoreductase